MSVAGGVHRAVYRAAEVGCDTVQIFTKSNVQWAAKPLSAEDIAKFHEALQRTGITCPTAHASYLINIASPRRPLRRKSTKALIEEVQRCQALGIPFLVLHPGSHQGKGEEAGLRYALESLDETLARTEDSTVMILLEVTAGQGTNLGYRLEHLQWLIENASRPERLGVCLDTCHLFAAGYPLYPQKAYQATMQMVDKTVSLERVRVVHLNDSKKPQGSRVDRHAHIGEGNIGLEGFRLILNDQRFRHLPMYLETPKEKRDGVDMDVINLERLRALLSKRPRSKAGNHSHAHTEGPEV